MSETDFALTMGNNWKNNGVYIEGRKRLDIADYGNV